MPQALAALAHLQSHRDGVLDALLHVVGVHEQHAVLRERLGVRAERRELVGKRHDPRVRVRARHGDVEQLARQHVRRGSAPAHDGRTAGPQTAARALRAPQAELRHGSLRRQAHARSLRGDQRLEVHAVQKRRLDELAIHDGAGHAHQRLVREHDGALEHRVDVHTQLEGTQVVEELRLEQLAAAGRVERAQVGHVLVRERELVHEVGQLRHAARDGVAALERVVAKVHVEAGLRVALAGLPIALRHGELVQVSQQRVVDLHSR